MRKGVLYALALIICVCLAGQVVVAQPPKAAPGQAGEPGLKGPQRSSEIVGMSVTNPQNERLGKINELIIGWDGTVKYAILSHGGVLGIGDKLIPIPWKSLKPGREEKTLIVNITKETLAKAPNFDPKEWPSFAEPEWQRKVEVYYELPGPPKSEAEQKGAQEQKSPGKQK